MKRSLLAILSLIAFVCFTISNALAFLPTSFADLVEEQSRAVVNVSTSTKAKKMAITKRQRNHPSPFSNDPFLDKFFDDFMDGLEGNNRREMRYRPKQSLGSGVVISKDGYIVTNNHVVEVADSIIIKFQDGKELKANIIGKDKKNDLSLLKVESDDDLAYATLGDSDKIRVGDWTIAIGNPFGLGGTVTAGILSARGRNIHQGPYDDFLQTDAAINPGNSGGPLFNKDGEIIGINTAILSRSGGSQGIGFAVPSNTVKLIIDQIKEHGRPVRGWLGVRIQTVTKALAEAMGFEKQTGALVAGVMDDSPSKKAGIEVGDLILTFDGNEVKKMSDLPKLVAETPVDKKVKVKLRRDGKIKILNVIIAELKEGDDGNLISEIDSEESEVAGMNLSELDNNEREALGMDEGINGVFVTSIEFDGRAAKSGLKIGDVIIEIAKKKIKSVKDAENVIEKSKGKSLLVLILRGGDKHFLALKKEKEDE